MMEEEKVGNRIKELRISHNLTQKELADKVGVTYQAVSKWENGKCLPDLYIITRMAVLFQVELSYILCHEEKKKKSKEWLLIIPFLVIACLITFIALKTNKNDYNFSTIFTTCNEFEINGVAAYNKDKTSIYISNISYCGKEENLDFKEIECALYEDIENKKIKINECKNTNEVTNLKDYLRDLTINVEHFSKECKNLKNNELYLEINGKNDDEKIITYKIPLKLKEKCA